MTEIEIFQAMGISLALTWILEILFAFFWGIRNKRDLLLVAAVNLLTNPVVTGGYYLAGYGLAAAGAGDGTARQILLGLKVFLEAAAIAAEGWCYKNCSGKIRRPWRFSCFANLFSYWIGLMIQEILV